MTINSLILNNISLAEKIAKSKKRKLSHISYDELKSAAYLGLVEAANNYNSSENDNFPAFAVWRIIGAVRDYLRELSWNSARSGKRSENIQMKDISCVDAKAFFDDMKLEYFDELIDRLPLINKTILKLYYQEEMKIKDIADDLQVHQSRISQILSESRNKLQTIWNLELCAA